jgi:hypothetical protein
MRSLKRVWLVFGTGVVLAGVIFLFSSFPRVAGWTREHWGSMSQLILGLVAILLSTLPSKVAELEKNAKYKIGVPLLIGIIAITGYVALESADTNLKSQIRSLSAGILGEATKDDIKTLTTHIDDGFYKVVDAINKLGITNHHVPSEKPTQEKPSQPQLPPAVVEHLRFAERRVPSTQSAYPYALEVVIQTDVAVENAALEIDFDGEIEKGDFFLAGQGVMMLVRSGITQDRKGFILGFGFPTWTPEHPIVATILSKQPVRVVGIKALHL